MSIVAGPRAWSTWDDVRDATSHDDSIWADLARHHRSSPTCHDLDVKNPITTLRQIESIRDREIDSRDEARALAARLITSFEETLEHPGDPWDTGDSLDLPGDAYVQWTRVSDPGSPLHVEVTDGSDYYEPMPAEMRDLFVDLGWNPPDDTFRNAWMWSETPEAAGDGTPGRPHPRLRVRPRGLPAAQGTAQQL